jgi:hypothetical protein
MLGGVALGLWWSAAAIEGHGIDALDYPAVAEACRVH